MRQEFNEEELAIIAQADAMEAEAKALRQTAYDKRTARDDRPLKDRLTFAATWRCACGHGMAYDPEGKVRSDKDGPFVMASQWECSAILLGIADDNLLHTPPAPFAFYEAKSEGQTSANGMTTREPGEPSPEAYPAA
jgi:hypothetical protein